MWTFQKVGKIAAGQNTTFEKKITNLFYFLGSTFCTLVFLKPCYVFHAVESLQFKTLSVFPSYS